MPNEIPITVIGAGPCGSFAALTIARQHVPVTVIEEHKTIGIPSHCAGHVGVKGLSRLGLRIPNDLVENQVRGARFYSPSSRELVLDHGSTVTYILHRAKFDKWLADQAIGCGASYQLNSRVRSLAYKREGPKLEIEGHDRIEDLVCNLVIDAEGYPPALIRSIDLTKTKPNKIVNGVLAEVDDVTDVSNEFVELYFGHKYASGFFAWIIPKKDGSAKIGLGVKGHDPISLLKRFISQHPVASKKLRKSKILNLTAHPIPLAGPFEETYSRNFLRVGDAALQVKPTTGGGIVTGMTCAQIAGEVAAQAWKESTYTTRSLSRYQSRWRKIMWKDFLVMTRIRSYLDKLSDEKLDNLFGAASKTGIMNDLRNLNDIDFQGSSLLSLAKHPRTLANVIRLVWLSLKT